MEFRDWLLSESVSGVLLAKAVSREGYESISRDGFRLGQGHRDAQKVFDKYADRTTEQNYGPGLYFSFVRSSADARKDCARYKEFGDHVVLATIVPCRVLITHWFPEGHPVWRLSPLGKPAGVYDQMVSLGIQANFPGFGRNDTAVDNEWGYKLSGLIDAWVHDHNMIPHVVVYNPSVLRYSDGFACDSVQAKVPVGVAKNPTQISREYDKNIPLSKQVRLGGFDPLIARVKAIQSDKNHPEYSYWKDFVLFPPKSTKMNLEKLD